MSRAVSSERLVEIADEVMGLIGAHDIFDFFDEATGNMAALEQRLQEVMMSRQSFECLELAMYLRSTATRQELLPTWQPLLNATIELIRLRGEDEVMLFGMVPRQADPGRNTDGVTGLKHPQLRKH